LNSCLKNNQSLRANSSLSKAFSVLLLVLVGVATSAAQGSKTDGALEGTISDASGGVIPGIKVVLRQIETNQMRTVYADDQGYFRAPDLLVGTYEVDIEDPRFAPYVHTGVDLGVGITVHLDVVLQLVGVTEKVTVSAATTPD
jgi:hypothetical protein